MISERVKIINQLISDARAEEIDDNDPEEILLDLEWKTGPPDLAFDPVLSVYSSTAVLSNVNLDGISLQGLDQGVDFSGCSFRGASLRGMRLLIGTNCDYTGADLTGATLMSLSDDYCGGNEFVEADLTGAKLLSDSSHLSWEHTDFTRATLRGAHLQGIKFHHSNFTDADFTGATIERCRIIWSQLLRVSFSHATFIGTDLDDQPHINPWDEEVKESHIITSAGMNLTGTTFTQGGSIKLYFDSDPSVHGGELPPGVVDGLMIESSVAVYWLDSRRVGVPILTDSNLLQRYYSKY